MADQVVLDAGAIHALLTSENGPVGVDLWRRLYAVTAAAKRRCPVDYGRLRGSIRPSMRHDSKGLLGIVGTDVEYAVFVHEGTVTHPIHSHGPWPLRNARTGDVFGQSVVHPGTTGVPFLTDALKEAQ